MIESILILALVTMLFVCEGIFFFVILFALFVLLLKKHVNNLGIDLCKIILLIASGLLALFSVFDYWNFSFNDNFEHIRMFTSYFLMISILILLLSKNQQSENSVNENMHFSVEFILLGLCLLIFTLIKAPFMGNDFSGIHGMKYASFMYQVGLMIQSDTPFMSSFLEMIDPVNNPWGIAKDFASIPLMEWIFYFFFKLLPDGISIELATRIMMNVFGCLFLIFVYLFLKQFFSTTKSLIIVFLLSINPIINFAYFVTVYDSLIFVLIFTSYGILNKFYKNKDYKFLVISGLIGGLAVTLKISTLLLLPFISLYILMQNNDWKLKSGDFLAQFLCYFPLLLIFHLISRTSFRWLPSDFYYSILLIIFWFAILSIMIIYANKIYQKILLPLAMLMIRKVQYIIFSLVMLLVTAIVFFYSMNLSYFFGEFLTDQKLLFNFAMYKYMLLDQFKVYATANVFYLALIGIMMIIFNRYYLYKNKIAVAFLFTFIFYWVSASKVIFFHEYYTIILMITLCLFAGIVCYQVLNRYKNIYSKFILLIFGLSILFLPSLSFTKDKFLSYERSSTKQAAQYLINNTSDEDFTISWGVFPLGVYADRQLIASNILDQEDFKKSVLEIGLPMTMNKFKIKYVVTNSNPQYERYANLFSDTPMLSTAYRRSDIILSKLDSQYRYFEDEEARKQLLDVFDIPNLFVFEEKVGDYKFYTFKQ